MDFDSRYAAQQTRSPETPGVAATQDDQLPQASFMVVPHYDALSGGLRRTPVAEADPLAGAAVAPGVVEALRRRQGGGRPLPEDLVGRWGGHFGQDLSALRVHTDSEAGSIAKSLQATAFTHGNDIYFAPGAYEPGSDSGRRVVAHEVGHAVAQRTGADRTAGGALTVGAANDPAELAADRAADGALSALRRSPDAPAGAGYAGGTLTPAVKRWVDSARAGRQPLEDLRRSRLESAVGGTNCTGIALQTDPAASALNPRMSANAVTFGPEMSSRGEAPQPGLATEVPSSRPPRRSGSNGFMQRAVLVGRASDPYEREADENARRVVDLLRGRASDSPPQIAESAGPHQHGRGDDPSAVGRLRRVSLAAGAEGGPLEPDVEARIASQRATGGAPIPDGLRRRFEDAMDADFGAVRLHANPRAAELSQEVGAKAFTLGSDIFLGAQHQDLDGDDGLHLLGHELTHTLQQGGAVGRSVARRAPKAIQRDVGFELESRDIFTTRTNGPGIAANSFADAGQALAAMNGGAKIKKGAALLTRPDLEVQADDVGDESDMEVVIDHLPEDAPGRTRLVQAMDDLMLLIAQFDHVAQGGVASASSIAGTGNFALAMPDSIIQVRGAATFLAAKTSPQVTMGLRLGDVGHIVEDLHGKAGEVPGSAEETARRPGRLAMRAPDANDATRPKDLTPGNEANTLVVGHTLAKNAVAAYHVVDPTSPIDEALVGFLTIIFGYTEAVPYKHTFMKNHTPLMAKTDLATMWQTLPLPVQTFYAQTGPGGVSRFEDMIATQTDYGARLPQSLFDGRNFADDNKKLKSGQQAPAQEWYMKLTLQDWLRSIVVSPKPSTAIAMWEGLFGQKDRRVDKLTDRSFPKKPKKQQVEGYGALGHHMDTDAATGDDLPVFELRSASRRIPFNQAKDWVLEMFDYIASLNANPGTGGNKIT